MDFSTLHATIPYIVDGKQKSIELYPYNDITLAMPGRHADQTTPPGGDFVVMVTDDTLGWDKHQFKHDDIFLDVELKRRGDHARLLMDYYYSAVHHNIDIGYDRWVPVQGLIPHKFLQAVQCLAVAEHRRYARYEPKLGGKYLPLRFAAGIADGKWTAGQAMEKQKKGRPGVEWLERENGLPFLTRKLMYDVGMIK
jgi:hypothetical protein